MPDKPKYDPQKHQRRSIRLKGYDYSQAGAYYVTFCLKDRECLFGKIVDGVMHLNEAGLMIDKWWKKIPGKFPDIELGEYVIMPNHFHAIAINVGADPCVRPATPRGGNDNDQIANPKTDSHIQTNDENALIINDNENAPAMNDEQLQMFENEHLGTEGEHTGSPLHRVVQWFKTMSTNEYIRNVKQNGWPPFNGKLWQRDYYEHIIRNEKSFQNIAKYIYDNPANWINDKFFVG